MQDDAGRVRRGAACAAALAPRPGPLMNVQHPTYMTFSRPVSLPGVTLGSGTYIFEFANPRSGSDVLRVVSRESVLSSA